MERESQILTDITVLENELAGLSARLSPLLGPPAAAMPMSAGSIAPAETARSTVGDRLVSMIRLARDLQQRLEV